MARCCSGATCTCVVEAGDGVEVTGIGSSGDPYVVSLESGILTDQTGQTIAYAEDIANTAIALSNGVFTALPPTFSVPPSTDDVSIRWGFALQITAAGAGSITIAPCDVTAGITPTSLVLHANLTDSFTTGTFSVQPGATGEFNFGPSATWRTFRLYGFVGRDAASSLAASMKASGTSPYAAKTWMKAVLG